MHAGSLQAIYLKHDACARFDTDVTEAEECAGQCSMRWLTTFNPITLEPSYKRSDVVSVPMGIVRADRRAAAGPAPRRRRDRRRQDDPGQGIRRGTRVSAPA